MTLQLVLLAGLLSPAQPLPTTNGDARHSPLGEALVALEDDAVQAQNRDLSTDESVRLALEIRTLGARVVDLTDGKPPEVQRRGLELERQTGRLLAALSKKDREAVGREAGALSSQITSMRSLLSP